MKYFYYLFLIGIIQDLSCHKMLVPRHRNIRNRKLMLREYSWKTPRRNGRRDGHLLMANMMNTGKSRELHDFYQPYGHAGDFVYLRTTHPPTTNPPPQTGETMNTFDTDFYNKAKIEDFRGCNLVCPKLYFTYGTVCGWTKAKFDYYKWEYDYVFGGFWNGSHDVIEIKTFDNLCEMHRANCRDHFVKGVTKPENKNRNRYVRRSWRLLHLGSCDTQDKQIRNELWFKIPRFGKNTKFWEEKSEAIMKHMNDIQNFPTRRTTRIRPKNVDDFSFIG